MKLVRYFSILPQADFRTQAKGSHILCQDITKMASIQVNDIVSSLKTLELSLHNLCVFLHYCVQSFY